ncbi:MAG: hypothetical protein MHM6MM_000768 [Cercozoa sp. M6MM]
MARVVTVLGGTGFVGQRVCQAALRKGCQVVSVSRSGSPHASEIEDWMDNVNWEKGDLFADPEQWRHLLEGSHSVISCVGDLGLGEMTGRICGVTARCVPVARELGVPFFGFVSAADQGWVAGWLMREYYRGKREVEAALRENYPENQHVIVKPGFIYGVRDTGSKKVDLGRLGRPMSNAISKLPNALQHLPMLTRPLHVDTVAAALTAHLDEEETRRCTGTLEVPDLQLFATPQ